MADKNNPIYNENDTLDINELASLNNDISNDFIEQLQSQVSKNASNFSNTDDSQLFEEVQSKEDTQKITQQPEEEKNTKKVATINDDIDDNFIKKYKAKLQKQQQQSNITPEPESELKTESLPEKQEVEQPPIVTQKQEPIRQETATENQNIEEISGGNIIERPLSNDNINYKESLDYLDNNTKYSKYVIYIDPENKDFIDSLTVKERKNLINRIIREQDDVVVTKKKLGKVQSIISHIIVAALTVALFIPLIYWAVNASLEATINNYRNSQSMFQTLYKEHGKIKTK